MFTPDQAKQLGWTFEVDGNDGSAFKDGVERFQIGSDVPRFSMLAEVAELEGFERPSIDEIAKLTGEAAPVVVVAAPELTLDPVDEALASVAAIPDDQPVTAKQLRQALKALDGRL